MPSQAAADAFDLSARISMHAGSRADRLLDEAADWLNSATHKATPEERESARAEYQRKVKEICDEFDRSLAYAERVMQPYLHEYLHPPLPRIPCEGWSRYEGD